VRRLFNVSAWRAAVTLSVPCRLISFFAYRMSAAHSRAMTYYVRSNETQSTRFTLRA